MSCSAIKSGALQSINFPHGELVEPRMAALLLEMNWMTMTLDELNALSPTDFIEVLGGIFEHSPWVPEGVAGQRPFTSVGQLHGAMVAVVDKAGQAAQLGLIRAHPDLAGKAARQGKLTTSSTSEQKGAGLDRLTDEEFDEFHALNNSYQRRFGFPFILAVRGHDKHSIMAAFRKRLENNSGEEVLEALHQIGQIARFRLDDLIS